MAVIARSILVIIFHLLANPEAGTTTWADFTGPRLPPPGCRAAKKHEAELSAREIRDPVLKDKIMEVRKSNRKGRMAFSSGRNG